MPYSELLTTKHSNQTKLCQAQVLNFMKSTPSFNTALKKYSTFEKLLIKDAYNYEFFSSKKYTFIEFIRFC